MTISQEASAPLVVVAGATGAQGGSIIKALTESDKPYRIRGLTRDPSKPASQSLARQGVELVAVDVQPKNKDKVLKAFEGAKIVTLMTTTAVYTSKEREIEEGKMLIDCAKAANVELTIWSGLENMAAHSNGKYLKVDHFDSKAEVTEYAKKIGIRFVNVEAGGYMQNYVTFGAPQKQADGNYVFATPAAADSVVPLLDADNDYGIFVRKAIESPGATEIYAYGEVISHADVVKQLSEITGKKVTYVQLTEEQYTKGATASGLSEIAAKEFSDMYNAIAEFGYYGNKEIQSSLQGLVRKPRTWAEFVKATDWSQVLN
ncbi:hypothetical protein FRB94_011767 [Tulasnella sp. JGI-2019a]|nr:hypothetical protein FRB93_002214 [Tulasnella sp. JGI-2019a]KAG9014589.1 hypothetical protein FRB94_011767 [Tulasnella sp. JGI-2019a]